MKNILINHCLLCALIVLNITMGQCDTKLTSDTTTNPTKFHGIKGSVPFRCFFDYFLSCLTVPTAGHPQIVSSFIPHLKFFMMVLVSACRA